MTREELIAALDAYFAERGQHWGYYQPISVKADDGSSEPAPSPTRRQIDTEIDLGEIADLMRGAKP
jgi:hypothetical protein